MRTLTPHELRFGAGLSRIFLAAFAVGPLVLLYPSLVAQRPVFLGYGMIAVVEQVLILREIGGRARAIVGGLIDAAILTFLIHRVGSGGSFLIAVYVYAALTNTLVVGRSVGLVLGVVASVMYCSVLGLEVSGALAYAPDAPPWAVGRPPTPAEAGVIGALVTTLLLLAAYVGGKLVETIAEREAELRAVNERLEALSIRDPLTDLFNRRHLIERMDQALRGASEGRAFAVLMFDLDGFKRVNDTRGHAEGDALLREIAAALLRGVRPGDLVCRYGGDEFVVLLWRARRAEAEARGAELAELVREVGCRFDRELPVTASVGVSIARPGDTTLELLRRADERAYGAKRAGGDRVVAQPA
jgi:diguanylate cyclase (GGDEF)-like protein